MNDWSSCGNVREVVITWILVHCGKICRRNLRKSDRKRKYGRKVIKVELIIYFRGDQVWKIFPYCQIDGGRRNSRAMGVGRRRD